MLTIDAYICQIGEESTFVAAFDGTIGEERLADAWTLVFMEGAAAEWGRNAFEHPRHHQGHRRG